MSSIKKTQTKFAFVMAAMVLIIVFSFCFGILYSTSSRNKKDVNETLNKMIEDAITNRPPSPNHKRFDEMRGFVVKLSPAGYEYIGPHQQNTYYSNQELDDYITMIQSTGKNSGKIAELIYLIKNMGEGVQVLAAIDQSVESTMFQELLNTVVFAGGGVTIILFILIWLFSFWIVKPTAKSFEKQKLFISEAGHQLKTPLTVIHTGAELLENTKDRESFEKWLNNIKSQTNKMNAIINQLLTLSKLDEDLKPVLKSRFDLSQAVLTEALIYETFAYEQRKNFTLDISDKISYYGDIQSIKQAVNILCDNAVKYCNPTGGIAVSLKKKTENKIILTISNTGNKINPDQIPLLFERFYRGESGVNGTGLGLAILKSLSKKNGWKIKVETTEDLFSFYLIL